MISAEGPVPTHVACIMDGNGRWATRRGLERIDGHAAGEAAILAFVDAALDMGIPWITLFAFSTENWSRPAAEVAFLMAFNSAVIRRHGAYFHQRGIRVRYLGARREPVPASLSTEMTEIEELTAENRRMTLTLAFNHGGRSEIADAVQTIVRQGVPADQIDSRTVAAYLERPDMPDPDLVIRTAGEQRLSNFLLWRLAYSELMFTDVLWPDFRAEHLREAVRAFQRRTRRFGGLADELAVQTEPGRV
ncbi:polyprenyl diphosphate synthase [Actinoplanes sp. NPDC051411]|uniref:polyprenyl diphosphate synthase n=1 Tax=Actinoplanes sp. NPDC051411 TaxID=3155522 RepID=UPI003447669C